MDAIGYCARLIPDSTQQCLTALMAFIQSKNGKTDSHVSGRCSDANCLPDIVVASAIVVLKLLVQLNMQRQSIGFDVFSPVSIISRLAYRIDEIHHASARACIIWLVGQYSEAPASENSGVVSIGPEGITSWAPDVLRKTAISFKPEVRSSFVLHNS